jgi:hypothetical protein
VIISSGSETLCVNHDCELNTVAPFVECACESFQD